MAAVNISIVTADRPPFVFRSSRTDGQGQWFGYLVELIPLLFQYANLNATLNYYESPENVGGALRPDGVWTGVTGELVKGRADLAAFPLFQALGRSSVIDLTYSYYESGLGVLVQKQVESSPGTSLFLKPFTSELWFALMATVLSMALIYHLLSWASPLGEFEVVKLRNVTTNAPVQEYSIDCENESFLLDALMSALSICVVPRGKSWSIRIPSIAYYFFTMIIVASYTANFASYLTVQAFKYPITSIEELAIKNKLNYVITSGGATETYFLNSLDPVILALRPRLRTVTTIDAGVAAVRQGRYTAYLAETPTLQYFAGQEPCDLQNVGSPFGPSVYTLGLQRNSPYTRLLNKAMLQLKQNGQLDALKKKWVDDQNSCNQANSVSNKSLKVNDFSGLWYLLLGLLGVGFLWALGEVLLVSLLARYPVLGETFINWNRSVANKRSSLVSRISSKRSEDNAEVSDNPMFEKEEVGFGFERSLSERNRAFDVFSCEKGKDEEPGRDEEFGIDEGSTVQNVERCDGDEAGALVLI